MSLHSVSDTADNVSQVMLKPECFAKLAVSHVFVSPIEAKIKECSKREAEVI
jgi:hypothetical protein